MKIACPSCGHRDSFTVVSEIYVTTDVDETGEPTGDNYYANEGRHRWINCPQCGNSWRTKRAFNFEIDVR